MEIMTIFISTIAFEVGVSGWRTGTNLDTAVGVKRFITNTMRQALKQL